MLALNPNPDEFGTPVANFEGSCNIDEHFSNMQLIFNIDFCGTVSNLLPLISVDFS